MGKNGAAFVIIHTVLTIHAVFTSRSAYDILTLRALFSFSLDGSRFLLTDNSDTTSTSSSRSRYRRQCPRRHSAKLWQCSLQRFGRCTQKNPTEYERDQREE